LTPAIHLALRTLEVFKPFIVTGLAPFVLATIALLWLSLKVASITGVL
jgi:hypothetical protein